jgi:ribonuclease BN (tRNA processing enzyme)
VRAGDFHLLIDCGASAHALRVEIGGRVIAYSGNGEWSTSHVAVADGAELFLCEAYLVDRVTKNHLSDGEIRAHREAFRYERLYLTHMSPDLLNRLDSIVSPDVPAEDGQIVEV